MGSYVGDKYGTGVTGTGHTGVTNAQKDRAAGRKGTDTPAQNANRAVANAKKGGKHGGGGKR